MLIVKEIAGIINVADIDHSVDPNTPGELVRPWTPIGPGTSPILSWDGSSSNYYIAFDYLDHVYARMMDSSVWPPQIVDPVTYTPFVTVQEPQEALPLGLASSTGDARKYDTTLLGSGTVHQVSNSLIYDRDTDSISTTVAIGAPSSPIPSSVTLWRMYIRRVGTTAWTLLADWSPSIGTRIITGSNPLQVEICCTYGYMWTPEGRNSDPAVSGLCIESPFGVPLVIDSSFQNWTYVFPGGGGPTDPPNAFYLDAIMSHGLPAYLNPVNSGGPITSATLVDAVPAGMSILSTGIIHGDGTTPAGSYTLHARVCNVNGCMETYANIRVTPPSPLVVGCSDSFVTVGTPVTISPTVISGGPVTLAALTSGDLPEGMTLHPNGVISGTPTHIGVTSSVLLLHNSTGQSTTISVLVYVQDAEGGGGGGGGLTSLFTAEIPGACGTKLTTGAGLFQDRIPILPPPTGNEVQEFPLNSELGATYAGARHPFVVPPIIVTPHDPWDFFCVTALTGDSIGPGGAGVDLSRGRTLVDATVVVGDLPPDAAVDATGLITGQIWDPTTSFCVVALKDDTGSTTYTTVFFCISAAGTPVVPAAGTAETGWAGTYPVHSGHVGSPLTMTPSISSGGPITLAYVVLGKLPAGMSLAADGVISGTPIHQETTTAAIALAHENGVWVIVNVHIDITYAKPVPPIPLPSGSGSADATDAITAQAGGDTTTGSAIFYS